MQKNFLIWLLVSLFYAYQYILRVIPNIIGSELIDRFQIDTSGIGQFSGLYYVGYTLAHIPVGVFLDRFGPKLVLSACIILTFLGTTPLLFESWAYCNFGRIIVGIGSSASAIGLFKVISMYYSQEKFAKMVSFSITIGLLGAMYGGLPLHLLLNKFGWDYVFITFIVLGCFLACATFLLIPKDNVVNPNNEQTNVGFREIKNLIYNKYILLISFFGGLMVGPLEGFADGWATTFFIKVYNISEDLASFLPSLIFIGMCFGLSLLAYILEKKPTKHYEIVISCAVLMAVSFMLLLSGYCNIYVIGTLLLLIGGASAYQVVATCKAISYACSNMVAIATAISNMIVMFFGYFFHTLMSEIIGFYSNGNESAAFVKSISIVPISLVIAVIGFLWLRCKENNNVSS
ncbi:MFS transporter [Candidatus Mesenet endosymbiont of Agriotes lineatus]|uniref:MFS transporter n=1 Tax=Candidatus Mesenet endosymbiont of Agriotes lineatus TaxID=3077948 RepID=UPI0030D340B6